MCIRDRLIDVGFNREVAEDCALYWNRNDEDLAKLIGKADQMSADEIAEMGRKAKDRVAKELSLIHISGLFRYDQNVFPGFDSSTGIYNF